MMLNVFMSLKCMGRFYSHCVCNVGSEPAGHLHPNPTKYSGEAYVF